MLTTAALRAIMPALPVDRAALFLPHLGAALAEFSIDTPARAAAFLAQAAHESSELARLVENLNYSSVALRRTWPTRFKDAPTAAKYGRKPEAIANKVYGGRLGNGPESSGDGWRYRGRGIFQLTGRENYRKAGSALDLPLEAEPDMVASDPAVACRTAGWYWRSRGLNMPVDAGEAVADPDGPEQAMVAVTRAINGGLIGLEERLAYWKRARQVLAAA